MAGRLPHFLCGARTRVWLEARARYAPDLRGLPAARVTAATAMLSPVRMAEQAICSDRTRRFALHPQPVFIVGHWQAGHSRMHELLVQDPQFACLRLRDCLAPDAAGTLRPLFNRHLSKRLPTDRGVDSLKLNLNAPQGDDLLLASLTARSIYYAYAFPQAAKTVFNDALLFDRATKDDVVEWQATYQYAWQRVASRQGKPRFVSRDASNTTRIPQLLEAFPEARFIHVHRHPEQLFSAQQRRWESLTGRWALQQSNQIELREHTMLFFERMMKRYLTDRETIPAGQLFETSYERLCEEPLHVLAEAYARMAIGGFDTVEPRFAGFLKGDHGALATSDLSQADRDDVRHRWRFAYDGFGYRVTEPQRKTA